METKDQGAATPALLSAQLTGSPKRLPAGEGLEADGRALLTDGTVTPFRVRVSRYEERALLLAPEDLPADLRPEALEEELIERVQGDLQWLRRAAVHESPGPLPPPRGPAAGVRLSGIELEEAAEELRDELVARTLALASGIEEEESDACFDEPAAWDENDAEQALEAEKAYSREE
ncbi:MAG: hypothetical protein MR428_08450 [Mesosutterella sp.]|nr:hypothetical protein [Mesosutterella sp.]